MDRPAPRIAIALAGHTVAPLIPRRGDFADWFRAGLGAGPGTAPAFDLPAGERPPPPEQLAGLVISGSPAMVTDAEPWSAELERYTRDCVERGLPVLGVCYGHQILARALGGAAGWLDSGYTIGSVAVTATTEARDDALFSVAPQHFLAQVSHSQCALELPPGARVLATTEHDPLHAFAVGDNAFGVQFHPEFDADIVRGYIAARRESIAAGGADPDALSAAVRDDPTGTALLRRFSELVRERSLRGSSTMQ